MEASWKGSPYITSKVTRRLSEDYYLAMLEEEEEGLVSE
jgi:hypothetical protein